jgi:hypothetical protein
MNIEDGLPLYPLDEPREARVARGVALLDEKRPGWRAEVNSDILDMASDTACVLGQLYGRYISGCSALGITAGVQATRYGFDAVTSAYTDPVDTESNALTEAWRAVLTSSTTPA